MAISANIDDRIRLSFKESPDGEVAQRVIVVSEQKNHTAYNSKAIAVGAGANGYNVKTTGEMFTGLTTSYTTMITNNDSAETITVYLNTDNSNPILIKAGATLTIDSFAVTNIFIDTTASQSGTVQVVLFGD